MNYAIFYLIKQLLYLTFCNNKRNLAMVLYNAC